MILNILNDSIRYAFSNHKSLAKIILCRILSVFIIPYLIICGFQYQIIEESLPAVIFEESRLPELNNLKKLLKNGIRLFVVKFIYLLIPAILSIMAMLELLPKLIGLLLSAVSFIVLYTYCFIAISNMVYHNSFKKAFYLNEIGIMKYKIGIFLLLGILTVISFIFYGVDAVLDRFILFLDNFVNTRMIVLFSLPVYKLLFMIISNLTILPFIDILIARISGIVYKIGE